MIKRTGLLVCAFVFAGCNSDDDASKKQLELPEEGFSARIRANYDQSEQTAYITGRVFKDTIQDGLVGGDVIVVTSGDNEEILTVLDTGNVSYSGSLPLADSTQGFSFSFEHRPEEARSDRWYPSDEVYVKTEPGQFVGLNGKGFFPDPVTINSPEADQRYVTSDSTITMQWQIGEADSVEVGAYSRCLKRYTKLYTGTNTGSLETTPATILRNAYSLEDRVADFFADVVMTPFEALFGLEVDLVTKSVSSCQIDLTVSAIRNDYIPETNLAGGILDTSTTAFVTVNFEPLEPFKL